MNTCTPSINFQPNSLAEYFLQETKIKKIRKLTPARIRKWPEEWRQVFFKSYPRFKQISLPKITNKSLFLKSAILKRKSSRKFKKEELSLTDISQLLFFSAGIIRKQGSDWNKSRRAYPSGGARYPLEVYLIVNQVVGLSSGLYHYNVKNHDLEVLLIGNFLRKISQSTGQDWIKKAKVILLISAVFSRTCDKYKDRGLRHIFMEAGHMGQNIYLMSTALGLSCCAVGGFNDEKVNQLLDLNGLDESTLYIFCLG